MPDVCPRVGVLVPACDTRFILSVTRALQPPPSTIATVQHVSTEYMQMMAYVISEGRLFGLKPSEWSLMLVGVALCGLMTLLF
jgi:hypothetical protein